MQQNLVTQPHYLLLDALRGVAALIVLYYHTFEGFATSAIDQRCNHGFLAVDFFFILSGFVIAYAYDDRFRSQQINTSTFFRRRLIRLHPMVIFGAILGFITFLLQGCNQWDFVGNGNPQHITIGWVMLALLLNLFLLPNISGLPFEVRGNGELFPLNGPHWSLFFEYIGNIFYALLLHRVSTRMLAILASITGVIMATLSLTTGTIGYGWTLSEFGYGITRMLFPYTIGMLLARLYLSGKLTTKHIPQWLQRHAFLPCAITLILTLAVPYIGDASQPWQNGLYIILTEALLFPFLLWLAVSGSAYVTGTHTTRFYTYLGNLSYPLYAIHYPLMYLLYDYIGFPSVSTTPSLEWHIMFLLYITCVLLATIISYLYDQPLRRYLAHKLS